MGVLVALVRKMFQPKVEGPKVKTPKPEEEQPEIQSGSLRLEPPPWDDKWEARGYQIIGRHGVVVGDFQYQKIAQKVVDLWNNARTGSCSPASQRPIAVKEFKSGYWYAKGYQIFSEAGVVAHFQHREFAEAAAQAHNDKLVAALRTADDKRGE